MATKEIVSERDRILLNYEKALNEGNDTLVTVATVLFDGVSLKDKYTNLSNTKKKKFNPNKDQLKHINEGSDGRPLNQLDISLLDLAIKFCGGLPDNSPLLGYMQQLKDARNEISHEKRKMNMSKEDLKREVSALRKLFTDMHEELKVGGYNTSRIPTFDNDVAEMRARMVKLESIWDEKEVLHYAKSESEDFVKKTCRIQTAEGHEGSATVTPNEIITSFTMLKVQKGNLHGHDQDWLGSDQIESKKIFTLENEKHERFDVVLVTGSGGIGKTTYLKDIGWNYFDDTKVVPSYPSLHDHKILIYLECRNLGIQHLDDLLKLIFPNTASKFGMDFLTEFKPFILRQDILAIVDGYDESHPGTEKTINEILQIRNKHMIASSRPRTLRRIRQKVEFHNNKALTVQLLGIQPEHFDSFVEKLLSVIMRNKNKEERDAVCRDLVPLLKKMHTRFGNFVCSPAILTYLTYLRVEEPGRMKIDSFTNNTDIFRALRGLKLKKIDHRITGMEGMVQDHMEQGIVQDPMEQITKIKELMEICDEEGMWTFIDGKYELEQKVAEDLERKGVQLGIKKEHMKQVLSTIYVSHHYYPKGIGSQLVYVYKFPHLLELEHSCTMYLIRLVKVIIDNRSTLDGEYVPEKLKQTKFWKYIAGIIGEDELIKDENDQISKYQNIVMFFIGELANLAQSEEKYRSVFEELAGKLIDIVWHTTYRIEWLEINEEKAERKENATEDDDSREETRSLESGAGVELDERDEAPMPAYSSADVDLIERDGEVENEVILKSGKEDKALKCISEGKKLNCVIQPVIGKMNTLPSWNITAGECFSELFEILQVIKPAKQLVLTLDSDPSEIKDMRSILRLLEKEKIITRIFFIGLYNGEIVGNTQDWISNKLNLVEYLGRIDEKEDIDCLPNCLQSLHILINFEVLPDLNSKLKELHKLIELDIRVELQPQMIVPKLEFNGSTLRLTLDCDIDDSNDNVYWAANVVLQFNSHQRENVLTGLLLQNTSLSCDGMMKFLKTLINSGLRVRNPIKVWTKALVSKTEQKNLDDFASSNRLGGFQILNKNSSNSLLSKTLVNVKSANTDRREVTEPPTLDKKDEQTSHSLAHSENLSSLTHQDILQMKLQKGFHVGLQVLVTVCRVLLHDRRLIDLFNNLSNSQKKKFNISQQDHIRNGVPLEKMDDSLLDLIRREFGGLSPDHPLAKELTHYKQMRNMFAHERQNLLLSEIELILRLNDIKDVLTRILRELKNLRYSNIHGINFDSKIAEVRAAIEDLAKNP